MKDREQSRIEEIGLLNVALNHSESKCKQLTAALEAAEAREAELRARVAELEGMVSDCQIMGFLQPKLDCSPTHRELVKRAAAAMAKGEV